jgi:methionyl-tRNA synthetase
MIDPETLIDPTCKTCKGNNLELKESKHLFFLLDKFQDSLKIRLETKTDRKANVMSTSLGKWIKDSLQPRCYTRDIKCGISVPLEGFEEKTIYVWFEAPLGYISITKKYFDDLGKPELFEQYWNDPETQLIEFIGKDNIVFHTIIWPALLMAYNEGMTEKGYILPANVPANEFLNLEGKKFSTSRGWAVWLDDIVANYNPDYIRFYLTCVIPETQDSDFKWKEFQDKCNNLCDSLGNLSSRVLNLSMKYCDGQFDSFDTIDRYFE